MARKGDVDWRGKAVSAAMRRAAAHAINETVKECVISAKNNHPGWVNRSSTAEGSIRVIKTANPGAKKPYAEWGSVAVIYMRRLEFEHGSALRNASQQEYPKLPQRVKEQMS